MKISVHKVNKNAHTQQDELLAPAEETLPLYSHLLHSDFKLK